jgi:hypothetical protein
VTPIQEDLPGNKVVSFTSPPPNNSTSVDTEVSEAGSTMDIEILVNTLLIGLKSGLPTFTVVQSPDCIRYTLSGEKACAYIYTLSGGGHANRSSTIGQNGQSNSAVMQLYSVIGDSLYKFSFSTLPTEFNGQLPIAEGMIRSFEVLSGPDVSGSDDGDEDGN